MLSKNLTILRIKSFCTSPIDYLVAWLRLARNTDFFRWSDEKNLFDEWNDRTVVIASLIPDGASVLEFGAGNEYLGKLLPKSCHYQPSDIVTRSDKTMICDLNEKFPVLDRKWDFIVLSGVVDYIYDVEGLLREIRKNCRFCIMTYVPIDIMECMVTRMRSGWVNHFTRQKLEKIIGGAKFDIKERKMWNDQPIYILR